MCAEWPLFWAFCGARRVNRKKRDHNKSRENADCLPLVLSVFNFPRAAGDAPASPCGRVYTSRLPKIKADASFSFLPRPKRAKTSSFYVELYRLPNGVSIAS